MAVTPNTTFVAGAIYTADQANRFGRGIMATPVTSSTTDSSITAEEVMLTYTFTAVNGRMYSLVYFEPSISGTSAATMTARIRETNILGTVINHASATLVVSYTTSVTCQAIYTASASGSLTIVATLQASAGTGTATRAGTTRFPQLYAIDIGAS
jgi:hypothetical protein